MRFLTGVRSCDFASSAAFRRAHCTPPTRQSLRPGIPRPSGDKALERQKTTGKRGLSPHRFGRPIANRTPPAARTAMISRHFTSRGRSVCRPQVPRSTFGRHLAFMPHRASGAAVSEGSSDGVPLLGSQVKQPECFELPRRVALVGTAWPRAASATGGNADSTCCLPYRRWARCGSLTSTTTIDLNAVRVVTNSCWGGVPGSR